jgi:hypothetical protein
MTTGLTDVDNITLKYFMSSQYAVETEDSIDSDTINTTVPKQYKERIVRLFTDMVNETPTAETTDKLETIFRAFVTESASMYRTIDAMPQQRALDTIDTQDIAIHELDKDLVKQIGTSGKRVMEDFVQYDNISKLSDPPRIVNEDKISSYDRDKENGKAVPKSGGKIIKKKKKTGKDAKVAKNQKDDAVEATSDKKRRRKRQDDKETTRAEK